MGAYSLSISNAFDISCLLTVFKLQSQILIFFVQISLYSYNAAPAPPGIFNSSDRLAMNEPTCSTKIRSYVSTVLVSCGDSMWRRQIRGAVTEAGETRITVWLGSWASWTPNQRGFWRFLGKVTLVSRLRLSSENLLLSERKRSAPGCPSLPSAVVTCAMQTRDWHPLFCPCEYRIGHAEPQEAVNRKISSPESMDSAIRMPCPKAMGRACPGRPGFC